MSLVKNGRICSSDQKIDDLEAFAKNWDAIDWSKKRDTEPKKEQDGLEKRPNKKA